LRVAPKFADNGFGKLLAQRFRERLGGAQYDGLLFGG
jgi:hypothetical protein